MSQFLVSLCAYYPEYLKYAHINSYLTLDAVPPSIRDSSGGSPVVVNVLVGNSVTLECESNAVPPPTITWYKNGRVVTETANLHVLAEGQMLQIKGSEVNLILNCTLFMSLKIIT